MSPLYCYCGVREGSRQDARGDSGAAGRLKQPRRVKLARRSAPGEDVRSVRYRAPGPGPTSVNTDSGSGPRAQHVHAPLEYNCDLFV